MLKQLFISPLVVKYRQASTTSLHSLVCCVLTTGNIFVLCRTEMLAIFGGKGFEGRLETLKSVAGKHVLGADA